MSELKNFLTSVIWENRAVLLDPYFIKDIEISDEIVFFKYDEQGYFNVEKKEIDFYLYTHKFEHTKYQGRM